MEGRDAQVSKGLRIVGDRLEEALGQIDEMTKKTVGEWCGQIDQLQNMVQQGTGNAGGGAGSGGGPAGRRARERQVEKLLAWQWTSRCGGSCPPGRTGFFAVGYQQPWGNQFRTFKRC